MTIRCHLLVSLRKMRLTHQKYSLSKVLFQNRQSKYSKWKSGATLVAVDNQPIISKIISQFPNDCQFIIPLGYRGKDLEEYLKKEIK